MIVKFFKIKIKTKTNSSACNNHKREKLQATWRNYYVNNGALETSELHVSDGGVTQWASVDVNNIPLSGNVMTANSAYPSAAEIHQWLAR